ncbi:hypothetical protein N7513_012297 [Penicillium frequentans]|nr:hypothetical protein N7513_012297 [Penicillium glabrum]
MNRLQGLEDDQSALSVNPWMEELGEREQEEEDFDDEEVHEKGTQASHPILPQIRSIPGTPSMPKTQTPIGLARIFDKVDRQIGLLDKQLKNVGVELLQAHDLVIAVRSTVSNLNKPEASELFEVDALSNYLRIRDQLKPIAKRLSMIVHDHVSQVVRAKNSYNTDFMSNNSDSSKPESAPTICNSMVVEPDKSGFQEGSSSSKPALIEISIHNHQSVRESRAYASDDSVPPPPRGRQPNRRRYSNPPKHIRRLPRELGDRTPKLDFQTRRKVHDAPRIGNNSNTASSNLSYGDLTNSSDLEEWSPSPYRARKGSLVSLPHRRQPTGRRYSNPLKRIRPLPRELDDRTPKLNFQPRRKVHDAPKIGNNSSMASGSLFYDDLADSSDLEDWPRSSTLARKKSIPFRRYPYHYTQSRDVQSEAAAKLKRRRATLSHLEVSVTGLRKDLAKEGDQTPPEEPRIVLVEPKDTQALGLREILQDEQNFLLGNINKVQDQLQAMRSSEALKSPAGAIHEVESSNIKSKLWTRWKSKFKDHSKKQEGHAIEK